MDAASGVGGRAELFLFLNSFSTLLTKQEEI